MCPADGAVYADLPDEFTLSVSLALNVGEKAIPGAVSAPPNKAVVASLPWTVACGHVAPGRAGSQPPQYAVYDAAMVAPLFTSVAVLR